MYCKFTPLHWLRIDIVLTTSVLHSTSYSELSILMMTGESIGSKSYKVLPNLSKVLYKHLDCLVSVGGGDEKTTLWQSDTKKAQKSHFISQMHSSIILTLMHCIFILIYQSTLFLPFFFWTIDGTICTKFRKSTWSQWCCCNLGRQWSTTELENSCMCTQCIYSSFQVYTLKHYLYGTPTKDCLQTAIFCSCFAALLLC